jgi:hypothetical protein
LSKASRSLTAVTVKAARETIQIHTYKLIKASGFIASTANLLTELAEPVVIYSVACRRLRRRPSLVGPLQPGDVELNHLQHRLHRPLRAGTIGTAEELRQRGRDDLPREAIAVF